MNWESLGSCASYITGEGIIKIALPQKAPTCQYCPFISCNQLYERYYCKITEEWLLNYKKERGEMCPFRWSETNG